MQLIGWQLTKPSGWSFLSRGQGPGRRKLVSILCSLIVRRAAWDILCYFQSNLWGYQISVQPNKSLWRLSLLVRLSRMDESWIWNRAILGFVIWDVPASSWVLHWFRNLLIQGGVYFYQAASQSICCRYDEWSPAVCTICHHRACHTLGEQGLWSKALLEKADRGYSSFAAPFCGALSLTTSGIRYDWVLSGPATHSSLSSFCWCCSSQIHAQKSFHKVLQTLHLFLQAMCRDYYVLQFMDRSIDTSPIAPALANFFDDVLNKSISQLNFKVRLAL